MTKFILILSTVPDEKTGQKIASYLIESRLAACVTVSEKCLSLYWWQDKISKDEEWMIFIKTEQNLYSEIEKKILEIHPYEVPEIIAIPILTGHEQYLQWIEKEINKDRSDNY